MGLYHIDLSFLYPDEQSLMNPTNRRILIALLVLLCVPLAYYTTHPIDLNPVEAIGNLLLPNVPLSLAAVGAALLDLLPMLLLGMVGGGLGRAVLGTIHALDSQTGIGVGTPFMASDSAPPSSLPRPERLALEGLVGLGLLSIAALIVGLVGQFNRVALWSVVVLIGLLCGRGVIGWLHDLLNMLRGQTHKEAGGEVLAPLSSRAVFGGRRGRGAGGEVLVLAFVVVMLTLALLHALIPPVAFDAVNYHLVGPGRYLQDGAIRAHADNHFLGFPQGVEILYGVAMSLFDRDTAAAPIHWWFGLLALLAIGGLVARFLGSGAGWWTVALTLTAWSLWLLFGWPYVDLAMVAYGAGVMVLGSVLGSVHSSQFTVRSQEQTGGYQLPATSYQPEAQSGQGAGGSDQPAIPVGATRRVAPTAEGRGTPRPYESADRLSAISYQLSATDHQPPTTSHYVLLGLLLGLAVGVKYTAAGLAVAIGVWLLLNTGRRWQALLRAGLVVGGVAALAYLPWALKGLLLYQNPVYPFLFGGLNWDSLRAATFSTAGQGLLNTGQVGQLLALPLAATIQGVEKADTFGFSIGPWVLTLPLLLLVSWRWLDERARALARLGLTFALPALLFWMVMAATSGIGVQTRLALFGLPAAAVVSGVAVYGLGRVPAKRLPLNLIGRGVLGLTFAITLLGAVQETGRDAVLPYLTGQLDRPAMLDRGLGVYAGMMRHLETLPTGSQVRFLYESKSYHCPLTITCVPDILFDYWVHPLRQGLDAQGVIESWRAAGDDYVLLFQLGYDFWKTDPRFLTENARFPELLTALGEPLWVDAVKGYSLYRLPSP
jgi:hypothetical protein